MIDVFYENAVKSDEISVGLIYERFLKYPDQIAKIIQDIKLGKIVNSI
jgi:hypothetical protein